MGEGGRGEDLVGQLDGGVDAPLWLETSVGGPALHRQAVAGDPFAGGLQRPVRAGLQDQGGRRAVDRFLDERT